MPSTHSSVIIYYATYVTLASLFLEPEQPWSKLPGFVPPLVIVPWATTIAISRVWLGHHTFEQVRRIRALWKRELTGRVGWCGEFSGPYLGLWVVLLVESRSGYDHGAMHIIGIPTPPNLIDFLYLPIVAREHLYDYRATTMTTESPIARRLASTKHIILVLSGKGGVGKSSVSTQLALSLYASSPTARIGILDVDLTGPSIPRMLGVDVGFPVHQSSEGWVPVYVDGSEARFGCMSVGFLVKSKEDSVVWRGPKKNAMIRQFLGDVRWGELDYLVIDTPPGESIGGGSG